MYKFILVFNNEMKNYYPNSLLFNKYECRTKIIIMNKKRLLYADNATQKQPVNQKCSFNKAKPPEKF